MLWKILIPALLMTPFLFSCGQSQKDSTNFENTVWKQSPEETAKAIGQNFSQESSERSEIAEGELLTCLYDEPVVLPVSQVEAENASFLYWRLDGSFQLAEVRLLFDSLETAADYRAYLDQFYGEP